MAAGVIHWFPNTISQSGVIRIHLPVVAIISALADTVKQKPGEFVHAVAAHLRNAGNGWFARSQRRAWAYECKVLVKASLISTLPSRQVNHGGIKCRVGQRVPR